MSVSYSPYDKMPQEAALTQVFEQMEIAHQAGDAKSFRSHFHPNFTHWPFDGSPLLYLLDEQQLQEAMQHEAKHKLMPKLDIRHLDIRLLGAPATAAIATFMFVGNIPRFRKSTLSGTWRISTFWIKESDNWKIAHLHESPAAMGVSELASSPAV
jgi:hypothetical protein